MLMAIFSMQLDMISLLHYQVYTIIFQIHDEKVVYTGKKQEPPIIVLPVSITFNTNRK